MIFKILSAHYLPAQEEAKRIREQEGVPVILNLKDTYLDPKGQRVYVVDAAYTTPSLLQYMDQTPGQVSNPVNEESKHLEAPGKSLSLVLEYYLLNNRLYVLDTVYGFAYIHRFKDEAGNELYWQTGSVDKIEVGKYKVSAKVAQHVDYGNCKQTRIKYCKLEKLEEAA